VYKEGDECSMIYIIKEGEFEMSKKFKKDEGGDE
jgi:CRP-like cAMP-binding protein